MAEPVPDPPVIVRDGFLSESDCKTLLAMGETGKWLPGTVKLADGRTTGSSERRCMSLYFPESGARMISLLGQIETRLATQFGIARERLEPWQMIRYRRGEGFDYHFDCGAYDSHKSGERRRSIILFLEQPEQGGATHFRALRLTVRPCRGRLLLWNNLLPTGRCNHAMIHSGRPVWRGRKTILATWEHEQPYAD
ncbi:MAG TPA: 2OG-Fe(II) oxygenase [Allosphingosinicella sp.]|nr:2OG-Fe(II) oxygenase [Allosphingosinicella sp.]